MYEHLLIKIFEDPCFRYFIMPCRRVVPILGATIGQCRKDGKKKKGYNFIHMAFTIYMLIVHPFVVLMQVICRSECQAS